MKEELIIQPLNAGSNDNGDSWFVCPLDCGNDDVCDKCDGVCKPTVS